jgi:hypothetical protein
MVSFNKPLTKEVKYMIVCDLFIFLFIDEVVGITETQIQLKDFGFKFK